MNLTISNTIWLIATRTKSYSFKVRMAMRKPKLVHGQVAIRLELAIPADYFELPTLSAKLSVKDGEAQRIAFAPGLIDKVSAVIRAETGVDVRLTVTQDAKK